MLPARIAARTDNPCGKRPEERAKAPADLAAAEPLPRATATAEVDASAAPHDVVRRLEALARAKIAPG
ncbi:hypothetical protein [Umezawaea sp.]|uniref:hypothetical protein n=1 Tax=Umezawaea sp. TaxID=1955258 RepID=UPI002ED616D1